MGRAKKNEMRPSVMQCGEGQSKGKDSKQYNHTGKKGNDKGNPITGKAFVDGKVQ